MYVCLSDGPNSVKVELQNTNGSVLQPNMPRSKLYKNAFIILHWRWVKFSPPCPHTLANSIVISQSTKTYMTNQNYPYSQSMLQWPTIMLYYIACSSSKYRNVCPYDGPYDVEVELFIILHWGWIKFSPPSPHTLAKSPVINQ